MILETVSIRIIQPAIKCKNKDLYRVVQNSLHMVT